MSNEIDFPAQRSTAMTTELADDCSVEGSRDELDVDDGSHAGRG